jgi:hypothetical protein
MHHLVELRGFLWGKSTEHEQKIGGILRIQTLECLLNIEELVHVVEGRVRDRKVFTRVLSLFNLSS